MERDYFHEHWLIQMTCRGYGRAVADRPSGVTTEEERRVKLAIALFEECLLVAITEWIGNSPGTYVVEAATELTGRPMIYQVWNGKMVNRY